MQELFNKFYNFQDEDEQSDWFYNEIVKKGLTEQFGQKVNNYLNQKKRKQDGYYYMLTFTLNPKLAERNEAYLGDGRFRESWYNRVEKYIKKLSQNKAWELDFFAIVREGGDEQHKHVHWHVSIKTRKYFDFKRNLSYYMKLYGNVDKQLSKLSTNKYAYKYMSKQCEPTVLLGEWDIELDPNSPNSQMKLIEWKTV